MPAPRKKSQPGLSAEAGQPVGHLLPLTRPEDDIAAYVKGYEERGRSELCEEIARRHATKSFKPADREAACREFLAIVVELRSVIPGSAGVALEVRKHWEKQLGAARARNDTARVSELIVESWEEERRRNPRPTLAHRMQPHFADKNCRERFFEALDAMVRLWLRLILDGAVSRNVTILDVDPLSMEAMHGLSRAWLRDAKALRRFLTDVFKWWQVIDDPRSTWRLATVTLQIAPLFRGKTGHDIAGIQSHLQRVGALTIPSGKNSAREHLAQQDRIRQILTREARGKRSSASGSV